MAFKEERLGQFYKLVSVSYWPIILAGPVFSFCSDSGGFAFGFDLFFFLFIGLLITCLLFSVLVLFNQLMSWKYLAGVLFFEVAVGALTIIIPVVITLMIAARLL
ncbi:MAG: hypothetical protein HYZ14_05685 [Bacteroidetes bacterium]|nr:hypothetical protein [Bacteroidota bacterium]